MKNILLGILLLSFNSQAQLYAPIYAGSDTTICAGSPITLIADNPWGVPIFWDNGVVDGVPFTPTSTMEYIVTADNLGSYSRDTILVTVEDLPVVSFTGDILSGCEPLSVTFTNTSTTSGSFVDCLWDFDGTTATGCGSVTEIFYEGSYDVTLTVTTVSGCTNSLTYTDYVYCEAEPFAEFEVDVPLCAPYIVQITSTSTDMVSCVWDMDEGGASFTGCNDFTYEYLDTGTYVIELVTFSSLGCTDTATQTIVIEECVSINELEISLFQVYPNPASNEVIISVSEQLIDHSFTIVDVAGKTLVSDKVYALENPIDISKFECGVYFIRFDDQVKPVRFLKY